MPRKYDRDNKGTPLSRTSAAAVRERHGPADFAPELVLRGEAVAIILSPRPVVLLSFSPLKSSVSLGFRFEFAWILLGFLLFGRGRDGHFCSPPAQNRTGGFPAYASRLGWLTAGFAAGRTRSRPCDALFRPCVRSVGSCPRSHWPPPFAQKAAPPVARPCSPASPLSGRRRRAQLPARLPPSAAQTGRAVFPHPAFMDGLAQPEATVSERLGRSA